MGRQGGLLGERAPSATAAVSYAQTRAAELRPDPHNWRDAAELCFHVSRLAFSTRPGADALREKTGGRVDFPAIIVITADNGNAPRWKEVYGSRGRAVRSLVDQLASKHAGSVYVHSKTAALDFVAPGDGSLPHGRSRFAILLYTPLIESQFRELMHGLRTRSDA